MLQLFPDPNLILEAVDEVFLVGFPSLLIDSICLFLGNGLASVELLWVGGLSC